MLDLHLTFEHHRAGDTLGIGQPSPRLSWRFIGSDIFWQQAGYILEIHRGDIKSHEKPETFNVKSSNSVLVPWPTSPLKSRERAWVRVKAIGDSGCDDTNFSAWEVVEMGLLERSDWKGEFIEAPRTDGPDGSLRPALFRKSFKLKGAVKQARLYITAHGIYETLINGKRVGDHELAPGWQSYKYHLAYQTFDVTSLLKNGENALGAEVGEGWWAGRLGWEQWRNVYGDKIGLLAQLEIELESGKVVEILSDESWKTTTGPTMQGEIYNGETYDATKELKGWSTDSFSAENWGTVILGELGKADLRAPEGPPVRKIETVTVKEIIRSNSNKVIIDLGQNLVGYLRVRVSGPKGHTITFRHAEVMSDGEINMVPLRGARATDTLILSGKSITWSPKFTFHGFRFVQVDNWPSHQGQPGINDIEAVVIHTDMEPTGTFTCSEPMVNQLHQNIRWGMRSNFVSIPTDCPQRDERLGWTGDIQVFCTTASFLYHTPGLLSGWLKDLSVEQKDLNGVVSNVVPNPLPIEHNQPQAAWSDAAIMTPWDLYTAYGDTGVLKAQFESMKDWLIRGVNRQENGLWYQWRRQLGDWLDPDAPAGNPEKGKTDPIFVANAYLCHVTELISKIAGVLELEEEEKHWTSEAARLKKLFTDEYVTPNGRLCPDTQTSIALMLAFKLCDNQKQIDYAGERLDWIVRVNDFKIGTGFVGTPIILPALTSVGKNAIAYRMLAEQDCPSWLYTVRMGGTTMWERWDSLRPDGRVNSDGMTSFNHYALGSVGQWLHQTVGGISPLLPGYKAILFAPQPGGNITSAKVELMTPYGYAGCEWQIEENQDGRKVFVMRIVVPANTKAEIRMPGVSSGTGVEERKREVGSGKHEFSCDFEPEPEPRAIFNGYGPPPEGMDGDGWGYVKDKEEKNDYIVRGIEDMTFINK